MGKLGLTRLTMAWTWGKPPPSPLSYILCLPTRPTSKWHFVRPEIPKVGTLTTLGPHNFVCRAPIEMRSKQNSSPHQELFNGMSHATFTQGNRVDS
jgi:hypothetical protein